MGCVIPVIYKAGSDGNIRAFYEHMLILSLIHAKMAGAGPVPVKIMFGTVLVLVGMQRGCCRNGYERCLVPADVAFDGVRTQHDH